MLTVVLDARTHAERLPLILTQLTAGAVDGLVRQVLLVAPGSDTGLEALCEESGAETCPTFAAAAGVARYDLILALPAAFRFRDGWIRALADKAPPAMVVGMGEGGLFSRPPSGLLVQRGLLEQGVDDIVALRRRLPLRIGRVG